MTTAERLGAQADAGVTASLRARVAVIAMGLFVTGLGWPGLIGRLPIRLLLKNQLQLPAARVAAFWAIGTFAWYVKPVIGLICDAVPFFGTRRRGYLIFGGLASTATWLAFAAVPRSYAWLLAVMVALNFALVVISTVVGGMLVETGQRYGATGRLSALRESLTGIMQLVAGPVGGWLAGHAFGWTVGAGTAIVCSFVPVALLCAREPGGARVDRAVWVKARLQLTAIARSRAMWATAGLTFLFYVSPGFQTALLYYQQDVLKFDAQFIGWLDLVAGASALAGAVAYGFSCRRLSLRASLVLGIVANAGSTLLFFAYGSRTSAVLINALGGAMTMLGWLPLLDLAARATPKGSESFGYSLILSVQNIALFAISDVAGSYLYGSLHWRFTSLVWVNALSTAAVLLFVPLLPRGLILAREGERLSAS